MHVSTQVFFLGNVVFGYKGCRERRYYDSVVLVSQISVSTRDLLLPMIYLSNFTNIQ